MISNRRGFRPRSNYVKFDDDMEQRAEFASGTSISLRAPITVTYGTFETPEFQRQSARLRRRASKPPASRSELLEAANFNHFEMCENLGNPLRPERLAALKLMKLA